MPDLGTALGDLWSGIKGLATRATHLYEIDVDGTEPNIIRVNESRKTIIFGGKTYLPFQVKFEPLEFNSGGSFTTANVRVGDTTQLFSILLEQFDALRDRPFKIFRIDRSLLTNFVDKLTLFDGLIQSAILKPRHGVQFMVSSSEIDSLGIQSPNRDQIRNTCSNDYKDELTCQHSGLVADLDLVKFPNANVDVCDKIRKGSPNGCESKQNLVHYNGHDGIGARIRGGG